LEIKQSKNESRFVILDAGINHLGGMTGLGRIPRDYTSISSKQNRRVASDQIDELQEVTVVGPLCSPLDCMARKAQLPLDLQPGDLIMVPNVGAYGLTASLVAFLTKPPPIEISLKNGHVIAVEQLNHLSHNRLSVN
jgi:diaminopimelate decarboxylase